MVTVRVKYKSGKEFDVDCYRYDRSKDPEFVLLYDSNNKVVSKLTKSRIETLGGKPL